jgi:transcription-repair coupling factor (superfamily II helicase)
MKTCRLPEKAGVQWIAGVLPQARPLLILDAALQGRSPVSVIFLPTRALARTLRGQLSPFLSIASRKSGDELSAVFLPAPPETVSSDEPLPERLLEDLACDRLAALASLKEARSWRGGRQQLLLLTTPDAFTAPVPPPDDLAALEVHLKAGDTVDFNDLQKQLVEVLDYDAEAICERPGQFAVRGGLIDVYPLNGDAPVRLDFFGDELESIRRFDPTTQRSLDTLPEVAISPRQLATIGHSQTTLLDWLGKKVHWLFLEPAEMEEAYHSFFTTFERIEDQRFNLDRLYRERHDNADRWTGLQELETQPPFFEQAQPSLSLATVSLSHWRDQPLQATIGLERLEEETRTRKHFLEQLEEWSGEGSTRLFSLVANTGKSGEIERLINDTLPEGLPLETLPAELPEGWRLEERPAGWFKWLQSRGKGPLVFVTEHEWLGRHSDRKPVHRQRLLPHRHARRQPARFPTSRTAITSSTSRTESAATAASQRWRSAGAPRRSFPSSSRTV